MDKTTLAVALSTEADQLMGHRSSPAQWREVMDTLLAAGEKVGKNEREEALSFAIRHNHEQLLDEAMALGRLEPREFGRLLLEGVGLLDKYESGTKAFLSRVDQRDLDDQLFMQAGGGGPIDCVRALLEAGANRDQHGTDGRSLIEWTAGDDVKQLLTDFVATGANPSQAPASAKSPVGV